MEGLGSRLGDFEFRIWDWILRVDRVFGEGERAAGAGIKIKIKMKMKMKMIIRILDMEDRI